MPIGLGLPGTTREKVAEAVANIRAQADIIEVEAATLTDEEWKILADC